MTPTCTWTEDWEGNWHTACGHSVVFAYPINEDGQYRFCPYCGKAIQFVPYTEEEVEL